MQTGGVHGCGGVEGTGSSERSGNTPPPQVGSRGGNALPPVAPIQTQAFAPGLSGPGNPRRGRKGLQRALCLADPTTPRPPPHGVSAAASRIAANCAPPPARPAVIAATVAAASRVSASSPPPRLIGAASGGTGGAGARPEARASGASTARWAGN